MAPPTRSSSRAKLMNPTPQDLKDLVLDYLMHNCHTSAARAFMNECGVKREGAESDIDRDAKLFHLGPKPKGTSEEDLRVLEERLAMGELRKDIRNHILTGRIDDATELLRKHFPNVLAESTDPSVLPPTLRKFKYRPPTSTDPTHIALNLRIQAFVEAARTIPLPYTPPGSDAPLPHPPLQSSLLRMASAGGGEDVEMSESDVEQSNVQLLHRAQSLYSEVNRLPNANDRVLYLGELGQVGGILAYTVPERSPLSAYMTQARREALADQIDSAILYWAKKPTISRIELYSRYTGAEWTLLHEKGITVPPRNKWPAGVSLPPTRLPELSVPARDGSSLANAIPPPKKATPDKEADEVLPPFDLHLFVESQGER